VEAADETGTAMLLEDLNRANALVQRLQSEKARAGDHRLRSAADAAAAAGGTGDALRRTRSV
jgi:hypothetical protein